MKTPGSRNAPKQISVIGIGNVLLGDDGFGPLTVELFRCKYECGPEVEVLDLGTPGLDLAPYLYGKDLVILVDAVHAEEPPGTLCVFSEDDLLTHHALLRLSAHDPGVRESLAHLSMAGWAPIELIIVGVVPERCEFAGGITAGVMTTASIAVEAIARLLRERGVDCRARDLDTPPNLWWLPVEPVVLVPGVRVFTTLEMLPAFQVDASTARAKLIEKKSGDRYHKDEGRQDQAAKNYRDKPLLLRS